MGALNKFLFGGPGTATSIGDVGWLVTRLGFGAYMVAHGVQKFVHDDGVYLSKQFIDGVASMGFPSPTLFAWMSALTEAIGAALIGVGFLTRPAGFLLTFNMCVAVFIAMRGADWTGPKGRELAVLFLLFFFLTMLIGGGRFAIDSFLRKSDRVQLVKRTDQ